MSETKSTQNRLDIALICGRRPTLLKLTLASFSQHVFKNFEIGTVFANIDPFCGRAEDGEACREIILQHFPTAEITMPETAGFAAAVRRNWCKTKSDYVFHLEDDWIALEDIAPDQIFPLFTKRVSQVSLKSEQKKRQRSDEFHFVTKRKKALGITVKKTIVPFFATSPCFMTGAFARESGKLMDPNLDPEKQFSDGRNRDLLNYASGFLNRLYFGETSDDVIKDIGREYREESGLVKNIENGQSVWTRRTDKMGGSAAS